MGKQHLFKITYVNNGKLYEIFARQVSQSSLLGFVEVGDFVFGEGSGIVIDPSEERLEKEFSGIKRSYIPINSVVRIDEVEKRGTSKISDLPKEGNVITPFPANAVFTGSSEKNESD